MKYFCIATKKKPEKKLIVFTSKTNERFEFWAY